jgi:hypothetical protein
MATIYTLLADGRTAAQSQAFSDAVFDSGGRLTIMVAPRIAIVDGEAATVTALQALIGNGVDAVGVDDVTPLTFAAAGSAELAVLVGTLALTTPAATAAANAVRPFEGVDWIGHGCLVGEA